MTDFPDPPAWVMNHPDAFPEVPDDYKPRKGDVVQHTHSGVFLIRAEQIAPINKTGHRVLLLANPLPKTRKFTIADNFGTIEIEGDSGVPSIGTPCVAIHTSGFACLPGGSWSSSRPHGDYIRLDRPFRIERKAVPE